MTEYTIWNLREASEALSALIECIESDPNYSEEALGVELAHVFHHLNTAWNARHASAAQAEACVQEDFDRWRRFPTDLPGDLDANPSRLGKDQASPVDRRTP